MNKNKDILIIGFALFSIFFGAGNLIFPPYIGLISGKKLDNKFFRICICGCWNNIIIYKCSSKSWVFSSGCRKNGKEVWD